MALNWRQKRFPVIIPATLLLACLALALPPHLAVAAPPGNGVPPKVLIQAEELKKLIDKQDPNLRVIDFRHQAKYYLGHLPGAIQMWRPEIENHRHSFQLPTAMQLEKLLSRLGISSDHTIIIYSDRCDHTRLWWLLAHYGFPVSRMRLLDGGIVAWKAKGYPTHLTSPPFQPASFRFPKEARQDFLLATLDQLKAARATGNGIILDIRPPRLYLGEGSKEGAERPGRIPGAVGIFWEKNRVASGPHKGCWKSPAELKEIYVSQGATPDKNIYIYGHTDSCATFTLVSLYLAGYPLEKLHVYGGSWVEWSKSKEPVATGPAR